MMDATLFIEGWEGTIVQQGVTQGVSISPNLPSGLRVIMIVSEKDSQKVRQCGDQPITVTDLVTGFKHRLRRASCGLGCRCAVEFC